MSGSKGLSADQVLKNKLKFGTNEVTTKKRETFLHILLTQFGSFFALILFGAAGMLFFIGEWIDFYVVLVVIIVNATIESIQKYRSDFIFENLTKIIPQYSVVIRDGQITKIKSAEIVTGDIVVLQAGDRVPADGILIFAEELKVDESILTGESESVSKISSDNYDNKSIIDNPHAVFFGSTVTLGQGHILVTHVGNKTQFGMIVQKISTIDTQLPIHKNIKQLSFGIFVFVLAMTLFVLVVGLTRMYSWVEISKVSIALLVSAIPESLPVMITLILAYGFKRMSDKNVLVRKMQSLDVLGQIDTLALDKTGTITHNQMKVEKIYTFNNEELYVTGDGYEPKGTLILNQKITNLENGSDAFMLIRSAVLSSVGTYSFDINKKEWLLGTGDPTEVALLVLGEKSSITKGILSSEYVLKKNVPFSNQNMYHSAIYTYQKKEIEIYTGAPEIIFDMCTHVRINTVDVKISKAHREEFHSKLKEYASGGYRVLSSCVKQGNKIVCKGLFAISDSIRPDVYFSVQDMYQRNINVIIITGDHKEVALQVAQKIGLRANASSVLTGDDMNHLTDIQLKNIILQKNIFTRVTPQQKLKILELLKELGKTIAMTGDGINDALALVKADIGIAMGTQSSDSAKGASDIILLDNKFGSIIYGIAEGKNIFSNIQKTIVFLLSTNFAEMFVVVFAVTLALPVPISAIGILWLNLVTDTFLVIGFAFEREKLETKNSKKILTYREWKRILYLGLCMTFVSLVVFINTQNISISYAQNMTLLVLIMMQWFNILNVRAGEHSIFTHGFRFNAVLIVGWFISVGLTVCAFSVPYFSKILHIHPISVSDWVYCILIASSIIWFEEIRKGAQKIKLFVRK
jgi:Ca2+-transporting ATPase